jgi:hypothetical protein
VTDPSEHLDDLLRRANPVDETRLPLPVDHPPAQMLYEKITGTPYAGAGKPPRRRLGTFMAAIAALVAVGGGAAYAGLRPSRVTTHLSVLCYGQDRLDAPVADVTASAGGPIAACSAAWAAGHVGHGPTPLLAACVAPTGIAAVFPSAPGANVCEQLGLSTLPVAGGAATTLRPPTTEATVFFQVRDAIVQSLLNECLDQAAATATIEKILSRSGLAWTVTVPTPFPSNRPCASPAFDETRRQVILVGIPRVG